MFEKFRMKNKHFLISVVKKFSVKKVLFFLFTFSFFSLSAQTDSNFVYLKKWQFSPDFLVADTIEIDSTLHFFHLLYNPALNALQSTTWLGNLGQPFMSNIYVERTKISPTDFFFQQNLGAYMINAHNNTYYNTNKPYSSIFWETTQKSIDEQVLRFTHSRNVNPYFNFGANYSLYSAKGTYPRAKSKNVFINLFASYSGHKYDMHATAYTNSLKLEENGGVIDTFAEREYTEARLESASSKYKNTGFFIVQQYHFGDTTMNYYAADTTYRMNFFPKFSVAHSLEANFNHRRYSDSDTSFYQNTYLNYGQTNDSVFHRSIINRLYIQLNEDSTKKTDIIVSVAHEAAKMFQLQSYILQNNEDTYSNFWAAMRIAAKPQNKFLWFINSRYFFGGYRSGNLETEASISYQLTTSFDSLFIQASANYCLLSPNYMQNYFYSNHFVWENNFANQTDISFKIQTNSLKYNYAVGIAYNTLKNNVFYGENSQPFQPDTTVQVFTFWIQKRLILRWFITDLKVFYQHTDNAYLLPLPELSAYGSLYANMFLFKRVLHLQTGFDVFWNTPFFAPAYMPATGVFYLQNEKKYGNYLPINAFITFDVKKVRVFFRFEHLNAFLNSQNQYSMPYYPTNNFMFKFGVSWQFLN